MSLVPTVTLVFVHFVRIIKFLSGRAEGREDTIRRHKRQEGGYADDKRCCWFHGAPMKFWVAASMISLMILRKITNIFCSQLLRRFTP